MDLAADSFLGPKRVPNPMAINATRVDKTIINPIATYSSMLAPHKVPMLLPIPGALPEIEKMPTKGRYLCSFARSAKYNITDLQLVKVSLFTKLMILLLFALRVI
jgi:hypothetical protein